MERPTRILVADDQSDVIEAISLVLEPQGWEVVSARSPREVLEVLRDQDLDCALLDLNYHRDTTTGQEGLNLLEQIRKLDARLPVIVMTAWGTVELAVATMQAGATDFVEKPWDNERLLSIVRNQLELVRSRRRGDRLAEENRVLRSADRDTEVIAGSPAMQQVMDLVDRVAASDANVLITGENGTGKTMLAREIHRRSHLANRSLISVNMGAVPEHLFESEMFGHVAGAFTDARKNRIGRFELADEGTLFLDEIANIPMTQQAKLLRVLEDGEFEPVGSSRSRRVQVRVLSATNADVPAMIKNSEFRKDLFFRLNTLEIHLPSLVDRPEDIRPLAEQALAALRGKYRREELVLSDLAIDRLQAYPWPGNVRELHHIMERAVLVCEGATIEPAHLAIDDQEGQPRIEQMSLDEAERYLLSTALQRYDRNVDKVAEVLGLSRSACYRRIEKHGL